MSCISVLSLDVSLSDFVAHLMSVFSVFVASCQCSMCSSFVVSCHCVRLSNFVACCRLINVYTNPSQYLSFSGALSASVALAALLFLGGHNVFPPALPLQRAVLPRATAVHEGQLLQKPQAVVLHLFGHRLQILMSCFPIL
jgi:hypothetical protein